MVERSVLAGEGVAPGTAAPWLDGDPANEQDADDAEHVNAEAGDDAGEITVIPQARSACRDLLSVPSGQRAIGGPHSRSRHSLAPLTHAG